MKNILKAIVLIVMSTFLVAWSFGDKKPKKSELKSAFKMELPGYVQLIDYDVEILENMGNKVDPRWGSRFKATVKSNVPLYILNEKDRKKSLTFVTLKSKQGSSTDVYGKVITTIYQGKWKHHFNIEGSPIQNMGAQLNTFDGKVLVKGSKEEKEYFAAIEQKKEKLRQNIANAASILIGTWRDNNSACTFNSDGTMHVKFDNGKESMRTWRVDGDILTKTQVKEKVNGQWKDKSYTLKDRLIYIDQNSYTIKGRSGNYKAKRIN